MRGSFFTPPSNRTKSCINSISRSLAHILSRYLSSLKRLLSCSSSFQWRKYFSCVPIAPHCNPSESLPATMNCTVLKNHALNSGCWFDRLWRMPSPMVTRLFFNCLLYTSDAADDLLCVDLGGRRIIKKKKEHK